MYELFKNYIAQIQASQEYNPVQSEPVLAALVQLSSAEITEADRRQIVQISEWLEGIKSERLSFSKLSKKLVSALGRLLPLLERGILISKVAVSNFPYELLADDELDLSFGQEFLPKCAEVHLDELNALEQAAMELESGRQESMTYIKRFLHTIKGDFGVVGVSEYAHLIHLLEDQLQDGLVTADQLLRVKDFLFEAFHRFQKGEVPKITLEIKHYLLSPILHNNTIESESSITEVQQDLISTIDVPVELANHQLSDQDVDITEDEKAISNCLAEDPSLLSDFVIESKEGIERVVIQILDLESGSLDVVNRLFRTCHTIKGLCGFIGLKHVGFFAHHLETFLSSIRKEELEITADVVSCLQESFDVLFELILAIERRLGGSQLIYPSQVLSLCNKLLQLRSVENENNHFAELSLVSIERGEQSEIAEIAGVIPAELEHLSNSIIPQVRSSEESSPPTSIKIVNRDESKIEIDEMIRVSTKRLDLLIDTIGETVIAQSMIEADEHIVVLQDLLLEKKLSQSNLLLRRIQELSMSLRMVPIQGVMQKMSRLVRDLSKKMSKNVHLVTLGEETELDKSIVEQIADPLMHMVRNSLDHGLESEEERLANGKQAYGTLSLRAFNRSGAIYIEIQDDGRGLDTDRILKKAITSGLCSADTQLTDQEIFRFIFHPGFSTAEKITDVSGRGVGMDVVKKNIDSLRGSIVIQSEKGKGTLFSVRLPLTLAIIDGMVIRSRLEILIIPTLSIVQSVKCLDSKSIVQEPDGAILYDFLGDLIPLVGALQVYNISHEEINILDSVIIVVEDMEGNRLGVVADEIIGQQQIVIKNLGKWLGAVPGIAGGAIMNNGEVSLIVDIPEMIRLSRQQTLTNQHVLTLKELVE